VTLSTAAACAHACACCCCCWRGWTTTEQQPARLFHLPPSQPPPIQTHLVGHHQLAVGCDNCVSMQRQLQQAAAQRPEHHGAAREGCGRQGRAAAAGQAM
jgi:hypothetical protein